MTQEPKNSVSILDANKKTRERRKFQGGSVSNMVYIQLKYNAKI